MKKSVVSILTACLVIIGSFASLSAGALDPLEAVSLDEARTAAQKWVDLVVIKTGGWDGSRTARVVGCRELCRGDRLLGYYCPVAPEGYVVLSLYKVLVPAKFYSPSGRPYGHVGVEPDVVVHETARPIDGSGELPLTDDEDPMLAAAMQAAQQLVAQR